MNLTQLRISTRLALLVGALTDVLERSSVHAPTQVRAVVASSSSGPTNAYDFHLY